MVADSVPRRLSDVACPGASLLHLRTLRPLGVSELRRPGCAQLVQRCDGWAPPSTLSAACGER
eukprot:5979829-Alexandrium_andersonii.AAC.1